MIDFRLCLITDRSTCQTASLDDAHGGARLSKTIDTACRAGVRAVQLREKDLDSRSLFELARDLRRITLSYHSKLLINDRVDVALAAETDGVHCPEDGFVPTVARELLGSESLIGVSCHSLDKAQQAAQAGADFVFYGPVFGTPSKAAFGPPVGLSALRKVCGQTETPVFAIGGITPERAIECMEAGASGVAVISAILGGADVEGSVRAFEKTLGAL
jgi:thiamine-phosphate pyrophosphorylase